jgi:hypothetical protein
MGWVAGTTPPVVDGEGAVVAIAPPVVSSVTIAQDMEL